MAGTMNPEVKAQWVEALRSGEYEQARGRLRNGDGYCCLGVLTDRGVKAGVCSEHADKLDEGVFRYGFHRSMGVLPDEIMDWAGLDSCSPVVTYQNVKHSLDELNDTYRLPFTEIADLIDASL
jgi:hypothetical protein